MIIIHGHLLETLGVDCFLATVFWCEIVFARMQNPMSLIAPELGDGGCVGGVL